MNKKELLEHIANGENSRVEFKRDDCHTDQLATEMAALLNLEGGIILLGVEDDGQISGLSKSRKDAEQWVMNIVRQNIWPATIPVWSCIETGLGQTVGVVKLAADSPGKPYKARRGDAWVTFTRVGSSSREATREEESRLYQMARLIRYDIKAVPDTGLESFDMERIRNYYQDILMRAAPNEEDTDEWRQLLLNSDFLIATRDAVRATVSGLLLFGENPNRRLPQAGVTAVAFSGTGKDYNTVDEERIRGPLTPRVSAKGPPVELGVIDHVENFVKRNMGGIAWLDGARRRQRKSFPIEAIREAVVNAVTHRDYAYEGTDIEVSLYSDRLEVISPGRLANGVTVEKMREGVVRFARNPLLKEILRDYGYVEHYGMGVRNRIIDAMRHHNETEAELIEQDDRFIVRLWKNLESG